MEEEEVEVEQTEEKMRVKEEEEGTKASRGVGQCRRRGDKALGTEA